MTGTSHVLLGLSGYAALAIHTGLPLEMTTVTAAAVGSLAPDIDHPRSRIGQLLWPISYPLARVFGHRGITHSVLALAAIALLGWWLQGPAVLAFGIGYALHLAADACTTQGVPLLYPSRVRFHGPLTVRTGGLGEVALTSLLLLLLAGSLLLTQPRAWEFLPSLSSAWMRLTS
ncbi:MAG: metal-dependent hydrolase [Halorhodospira sp.]